MNKPISPYHERWAKEGNIERLYYKAPNRLKAMELVIDIRRQGFDAKYEPFEDTDNFTDHDVYVNVTREAE